MNISQAVRSIREKSGQSQQAFSSDLGFSISAIQNYESPVKRRIPESKQMLLFVRHAEKIKAAEESVILRRALRESLGADPDKRLVI